MYYTNLVGNIIDNNDPMSSSVVTGRNSAESLLSSGVPLWMWTILLQLNNKCYIKSTETNNLWMILKTYDLEFDRFSIQLNSSDFEIHSDCADETLSVSVVLK